MEDLKAKTIRSSIWTFLESGLVFIVEFVFNIILARLLTPHDYGIYGILMIFIIISRIFVNSGLGAAIIREKNTTDSDLSTVFFANLSISIFIYLLLFFSSIFFVGFFDVENLSLYIKIISLVLIVDAFTIIQRTILTKELNFKKQTILNTISVLIAGAIGIFLAYSGYGVYSLIFKILIHYTLLTILLWITSNWKPRLVFDWIAFKRLFNFSYKLLLSGLLNQFYKYFYYFIIGKFFTIDKLGYYNRAESYANIPTDFITAAIMKVTYPVLSRIQDEKERLRKAFVDLTRMVMFIIAPIIALIILVSDDIIVVLIGEKWLPASPYLQLLISSFILYPIQRLNSQLLNIMGLSNKYLKLEFIAKVITLPIIIIALFFSVRALLYALILNSIIAYFINGYYTNKLIDLKPLTQLRHLSPYIMMSVIAYIVSYFSLYMFDLDPLLSLMLHSSIFASIYLLISWIFKINEVNLVLKYFKKY